MSRELLFLLTAVTLLGAGCGAAYSASESMVYDAAPVNVGRTAAAHGGAAIGLEGRAQVAGDVGGDVAQVIRKVIYTALFTVDVYDIKASQDALQTFVEERGGHLQHMAGLSMVVRIPSDRFKEVEPYLRTLGRIDERLTDIRAQDITEQYYDIELRLKTKKKYLTSLYKLMDEAGELKEKLAVQQEIARVVEEIERLEGRLRLLSNQVALATVTVTWRLAHSGAKRTFELPWGWLDTLGVENLTR